MIKRTLNRRVSIRFVFILTFLFIIINELTHVHRRISTNYSNTSEVLPSAEDPAFAPKTNSIYFHDTSFYGGLTPRQACSIESAARVYPRQDVYVLFSSPVTQDMLKTSCLAKLLEFSNVKLLRVHIAEYSKGTAVQSILFNDLKESAFAMQHAADILKILTLHKWGGICVETDMILIKSLQRMPPNWIVQQYDAYVATGIMSFSNEVGRNLTGAILEEIKKTYNPNDAYSTGEKPIKRVIQRICPKKMHWSSCEGNKLYFDCSAPATDKTLANISELISGTNIGIFPYDSFYRIENILWLRELKLAYYQPNYSFQIWNAQSDSIFNDDRDNKFQTNDVLAKKYCPSIYLKYRDELDF